jgi:hypothetical protein
MDRNAYFQDLKALAREKRKLHRVNTAAFGLREVRQIYKLEGIRIDYWSLPTKRRSICARMATIRSLSSARFQMNLSCSR